MANFDKIFEDLILVEGGYTDHPLDLGGKTKFGITEEVARAHGYTGSMRDLSLEFAKRIYYESYFVKYGFQHIQNTKIAGELFEFTVNTGRGKTAVKFLQRAYNALNKNYQLKEDGILGHHTASSVNKYKFYKSIYKVLNIFQGMYYISLAENDSELKRSLLEHEQTEGSKRFKTFIRGWIDKRVNM